MNKIIVPIDFSEYSEYALEAAAQLAKQFHAEIVVVHMLELSDAILTKNESVQDEKAVFYLKLAEKRFETFLDQPYLDGITVTPLIKHYKVYKELGELVEDHSGDLIVMGSHGTSGTRDFFVGSNTEKMIRYSKVPVLVIKSRVDPNGLKRSVFVSDFENESLSVFDRAMKLLQKINSSVSLVYVNRPNNDFRSSAEMRAHVAGFLNQVDRSHVPEQVHYVSDYSIEEGVFNFAGANAIDLIVIPTHGRTGLAHLLKGSISEDIANRSSLPVLTLRI